MPQYNITIRIRKMNCIWHIYFARKNKKIKISEHLCLAGLKEHSLFKYYEPSIKKTLQTRSNIYRVYAVTGKQENKDNTYILSEIRRCLYHIFKFDQCK